MDIDERTHIVNSNGIKSNKRHSMGGGLFCNLPDERDQRWVHMAIDGELAEIERLSYSTKPPKLEHPRSPITLCMLKIASVVNGYSLSGGIVYQSILFALRAHPVSRQPRKIEYQWRRMLKRARPRRRQN